MNSRHLAATPARTFGIFGGIAVVFILASASPAFAQHRHLRVGAATPTQEAPLYLVEGAELSAEFRNVHRLVLTNSGRYAGYYQSGGLVFTVLAQTLAYGGPEQYAPALGSFIQLGIVSVDGPPGGAFGFWESGSVVPTVSVSSTSTNLWPLTQTFNEPGSDPYGHIHGRRLTATLPGLYKVRFVIRDTSTNGAGGGPIHRPSQVFEMYFNAGARVVLGPDVEWAFVRAEGHMDVQFSTPVGLTRQLVMSSMLATGAVWLPVGGPIVGDNHFHKVAITNTSEPNRFLRFLHLDPPPPQ